MNTIQYPIRVALLISSLRTGGKEHVTIEVLRKLNRQIFDPFLCVMNEGELLERIPEQRIYARLARFPGDVLGYAWRLFRIFRRERPQVVVCASFRLTGWVGRSLGWFMGVPVLIYEHHGVEHAGQREIEIPDRLLFNRFTDRIIALGAESRDLMLREGISEAKIAVIRNGIDTQRFQLRHGSLKKQLFGLEDHIPVVGCITKMRPKKNLTMLVDAFQQLLGHLPQAQLVIAGDGPECARLKAYIDDLGLWANIRLLGLRTDVPELMSAFDVLALSSTTEAAPMVILEAGACQRPVVATAVGDIPEMIVHGRTGYLVPSGDTAGLANYLLELLLHPEQRQMMGQAARVHVEAHFSIEASVRAREALFLQLLKEKGLCPE